MKRFTLAALAVFLSACASSPERPDAYDYSGATAAPPAYTPAGAGAPARGQPGAIDPDRPTLPRSPDKRILPTRQDGAPAIYAADGDDQRAVRLLFTQPAPATPEGISPSAHAKCWEDVQTLMRKDPRVLKLSLTEARCLRSRLYNHCGARMVEAAESGNADFLERYPPQPMTAPAGQSPRGARTVGAYNSRAFEDATTGRRNARECGPHQEYWTPRTGPISNELSAHGDDVMGWRNP